jgi:hypothetical protein
MRIFAFAIDYPGRPHCLATFMSLEGGYLMSWHDASANGFRQKRADASTWVQMGATQMDTEFLSDSRPVS